MELLADKFRSGHLCQIFSSQVRSPISSCIVVLALLKQLSWLSSFRSVSPTCRHGVPSFFHAEPPHCREAAQQASETSFALLEGTQEIVLITPAR